MPRSSCTASSPSEFLFLQKFSCKKCYTYVGLVALSSLPWNGFSVLDLKNAVKKEKTQGDSNNIFLGYISASLCHWTALFFMGRNVAWRNRVVQKCLLCCSGTSWSFTEEFTQGNTLFFFKRSNRGWGLYFIQLVFLHVIRFSTIGDKNSLRIRLNQSFAYIFFSTQL